MFFFQLFFFLHFFLELWFQPIFPCKIFFLFFQKNNEKKQIEIRNQIRAGSGHEDHSVKHTMKCFWFWQKKDCEAISLRIITQYTQYLYTILTYIVSVSGKKWRAPHPYKKGNGARNLGNRQITYFLKIFERNTDREVLAAVLGD